jgi:hypothetical protein
MKIPFAFSKKRNQEGTVGCLCRSLGTEQKNNRRKKNHSNKADRAVPCVVTSSG